MIKLVIPIYANISKTKKTMVGMNGYRNWHFQTECKLKKHYHEIVFEQLKNFKSVKFCNKIKTKYRLFYKNENSDMMNVIAVIDKYILDALQLAKVISDDNVKNYVKCSIEIAECDKKNPRVEVEIEEMI